MKTIIVEVKIDVEETALANLTGEQIIKEHFDKAFRDAQATFKVLGEYKKQEAPDEISTQMASNTNIEMQEKKGILYAMKNTIHPDCPLEDYKKINSCYNCKHEDSSDRVCDECDGANQPSNWQPKE